MGVRVTRGGAFLSVFGRGGGIAICTHSAEQSARLLFARVSCEVLAKSLDGYTALTQKGKSICKQCFEH